MNDEIKIFGIKCKKVKNAPFANRTWDGKAGKFFLTIYEEHLLDLIKERFHFMLSAKTGTNAWIVINSYGSSFEEAKKNMEEDFKKILGEINDFSKRIK